MRKFIFLPFKTVAQKTTVRLSQLGADSIGIECGQHHQFERNLRDAIGRLQAYSHCRENFIPQR
jgi:hypothetical protein